MEFGGLENFNKGSFFKKDLDNSNNIIFEESESLEVSSKEQSVRELDLPTIDKLQINNGGVGGHCSMNDNKEKDSSKLTRKNANSTQPQYRDGYVCSIGNNVENNNNHKSLITHDSISTIDIEKELDNVKISNSYNQNNDYDKKETVDDNSEEILEENDFVGNLDQRNIHLDDFPEIMYNNPYEANNNVNLNMP